MTCEHCQQQMLPYLYDLLESQEREELLAHLEACPTCQEALKLAQEQQGQFAEAVKQPQPGVAFKAPPMVVPASSAPTVAMQAPPRGISFVNRWIIAACVVGVILGGVGGIGVVVWRIQLGEIARSEELLAKAREDLKRSQELLTTKKNDTQQEIQKIQKEIDELFDVWKSNETRVRQELQNKGAQLRVTGPPSPVAGGRNTFEVELTQNGPQQNFFHQQKLPGASPMQARVVDQKNRAPLTDWTNLKADVNNRANYTLPPDLPQPGQQIALEFQAQTEKGEIYQFNDNLTVAAPEYVTHLTTDLPLYRPGQTVRFRSLTLERFSLKPAQEPLHLRFRIVRPDGKEVYNKDFAGELVLAKNKENLKGIDGTPLLGIGAGDFELPADAPSGHYTLSVSEANERFREEKRVFTVNRWQTPRFHKEVTFDRTSYGGGDRVRMTVRAAALQTPGGIRSGIQVHITTNVDGQPWTQERSLETDRDGVALFEFTLPERITRGVGTVTVKFQDGSNEETIQRTLPLVVRDLDVDFYPEGGDLILGVPNRVYFQARTKANRPADIEGRIVDDAGAVVARVQTVTDPDEPGINQGLGSFTFTPKLKRRYTLRLDAPIGVERVFALPTAKSKGLVMHSTPGVIEHDIDLTLHNADVKRTLLVGAYCRGRWIAHKDNIHVQANSTTRVKWQLPTGVAGVYRITVFERKGLGEDATFHPLAERLVYRKGSERVDVNIVNEAANWQPGQNVRLRLEARNEAKQFVPTYALVAVVDQSVLKLADEKTARSLPTHFLLTTEVRAPEDLEHADVLLGSHPKAALALDLLLGCQGWRRFAEQDPEKFTRLQKVAPVFLTNSVNVKQFLDNEQKQIEKLDQNYVAKAIDLQKKLGEKEQVEDGPPDLLVSIEQKKASVNSAAGTVDFAEARLRQTKMFLLQFSLGAAMLAALFAVFYVLSSGLQRLSEGRSPRLWFTFGLGLFTLLFFASVIGTFALKGEHVFDFDGRRWARTAPMPADKGLNPNFTREAPMPPLEVGEDVLLEVVPVGPEKPRDIRQPFDKPLIEEPDWVDNNFNLNNDPILKHRFGVVRADRLLRDKGDYQAILRMELGRRVQLPAAEEPCIVREYAHRRAFAKGEGQRDLSETLYWHPALVLADGKAELDFDLTDAVTRFEVLVVSNTADGRLGANRATLTAKLPVSVLPKTPTEVSKGDVLTIPVQCNNGSANEVALTLITRNKGLTALDAGAERGLSFKPNEQTWQSYRFKPSLDDGQANFRLITKTTNSADAVERKIKVTPDGFPFSESVSGILDSTALHDIVLPEEIVAGSLKVQAHFYPAPLAELQGGVDSLLREPGGFELIGSSNYLNARLLHVLTDNKLAEPSIENLARTRMRTGIQKLATFEGNDAHKGTYESLDGAAAPHAALTAFGLLQFRAITKVTSIEPATLAGAEKYLIDQLGRTPDAVTKAYLVWALTEAGSTANLDKELQAQRDQGKASKDPYFLALVALSHANRQRGDDASSLMRRLRDMQKPTGEIPGAIRSVTGVTGDELTVQTTALALLGWSRTDSKLWHPPQFATNISGAAKWLSAQRRNQGDFGGPQTTVLALEALTTLAARQPLPQMGTVEISLRGSMPRNEPPPFRGRPVEISSVNPNLTNIPPRAASPITLSLHDASAMSPGKNTIQLSITNRVMPYTLTWSYRVARPPIDPKAAVKLSAKFDKEEIKEGDTIKLTASLENPTGKAQGLTVAILGIPAGLTLAKTDALDRLKADGVIGSWELHGRELVLYWRELTPKAKVSLDLDLTATLPGNYRGPASRAYVYHAAQHKFWLNPLHIRIDESTEARVKAVNAK